MTAGGTLAYVLWHWRQPPLSAAQYEAHLAAFHAALAAHPPAGFKASTSVALSGAPWANGGGDAYQDRYLIDGSAALDVLDRGVMEGPKPAAHDHAAGGAGGGAAGLYALRLGVVVDAPRHAAWFTKPGGMSYDALFVEITPLLDGASGLWSRRMVLGPTPEFCLESQAPVVLPERFAPLCLELTPI